MDERVNFMYNCSFCWMPLEKCFTSAGYKLMRTIACNKIYIFTFICWMKCAYSWACISVYVHLLYISTHIWIKLLVESSFLSVKNNREFLIEQVLVITNNLFQWENRRFNRHTTVNSSKPDRLLLFNQEWYHVSLILGS